MTASAEFAIVVDWLMYGGGLLALMGLGLSFVRDRGTHAGGLAKPMAYAGIALLVLGVLLGLYGDIL